MRKTILLLLSLLILVSALPAMAQAPSDVPAEHWAIEAIRDLYTRGIFVGYPDDSFRGDRAVTRYELAVVLSRLLESLPEGADLTKFVTRTELQTTLKNYPTQTDVQNTLKNYATKAELQNVQQGLQNALNNYVTKTEFQQRLATLATKDDVARLQRLVENLRTELTALGVRVDEAQRKLTALETRVASLEQRVTDLENKPVPAERFSLNIKGGVAVRSVNLKEAPADPDATISDEFDRQLVEGFSGGAAFDISAGFRLDNNLAVGARVLALNDNLGDATLSDLDSFDTRLGLFLTSGDTRLDLGVFDAYFTPFTLANSTKSILEQIPAFGNDWYFSGVKLGTRLGLFDITALYSNTRDLATFEDTGDIILTQFAQDLFAARAVVAPTGNLRLGASYVIAREEDAFADIFNTIFPYPSSNRIWSLDADLDLGAVRLSGEYADSQLKDVSDPAGDVFNGTAFKVGAGIGFVDAYLLSIGSLDNPFYSTYGDPPRPPCSTPMAPARPGDWRTTSSGSCPTWPQTSLPSI